MLFKDWITALTDSSPLTLQEIAEALGERGYPTTQQTISAWRRIGNVPRKERWPALAEILGVTTADFGAAVADDLVSKQYRSVDDIQRRIAELEEEIRQGEEVVRQKRAELARNRRELKEELRHPGRH